MIKCSKPFIFLFLLLIFFSLSACSLTADITPPPDAWQPTASEPISANPEISLQPYNFSEGKALFVENCASCHGAAGLGDGEDAADLPFQAAPLGSKDFNNAKTLSGWYQVVTDGRVEHSMPSFASLTDQQRWDVVAYAFLLGFDPTTLGDGKDIYAQECATCHGTDGKGKPVGERVTPDFSDPKTLTDMSNQDIGQIIANGNSEGMPAFSEKLSQQQQSVVIDYVRAFAFSGDLQTEMAIGSSNETSAIKNGEKFSITGQIKNPAGTPLSELIEVYLTGYDDMVPTISLITPIDANGAFAFENLEFVDERVYQVTADYQGLTYRSDAIHPTDIQPGQSVEISLDVYETTTDASWLTADRVHVFFDITNPDTIQVVELFILDNPSDKVIISNENNDPIFSFRLPANTTNLQFDAAELGTDYALTADGFDFLQPIAPGAGQQILFAYEVPHPKKFDLLLNLPFEVKAAVVMIPKDGVTIENDQLTYSGERLIQDINVDLYSGNDFQKGSDIKLSLSTKKSFQLSLTENSSANLAVGLAIFALVLIGAGVWLYRKKDDSAQGNLEDGVSSDSVDSLLDAIVALDDLFQEGELPEEAYKQRRNDLIERLKIVRNK